MDPVDPERERTVLALLEELLRVAESRRAALLEDRCAGDERLRERVLALLPLEGDLGPAPWAGWIDREGLGQEAVLAPGTRVDSYEIVRAVAIGGMGRVYEARQADPDRRVALKVLRLELGSEEMERRFRYESELLARLRHPGIAMVYEAGICGGAPWMALEYVEDARPIDVFAAEERLDRRAVLELFLQVLDAVQHGHQRGVIHRDVKPANVLVDGAGRVKLIDFGVARATAEGRGLTLHGELVGTVSTMSPEQADGSSDVDAQSDVYSLGVVLYELLCGRPPHDLDDLSVPAAARAIVERQPTSPRSARPDLERDLEAVLLTALEKDRARRYRSAADFADDLRAFLAGRPIAARPPGPGRQVVLFLRRNPAFLLALATASLALLVATVVSVRFGLAERAARREAEQLQEGLLDQSFALHMHFAPRLAELEGSLEVRRAMIQEAIDKLELLEDRLGGDPDARRRLALAYRSLGDVLGNPTRDNLGDLEGAEACYRRALSILEPAGTALPGAELDASRLRMRLAELALTSGRPAEALPLSEGFVEVASRSLARGEAPDGLEPELAAALIHAGSARGLLGESDRALEHFLRAWGIRRELLARDPGDPELELQAAVVLSKVGTARWRLGDPRAIDDLLEALAQVRSVAASHPRVARYRRSLVETVMLVSDVLLQNGRIDRAQEVLDAGLQVSAELSASDPQNAFYRRQRGLLTYNQAWLLRDRGRLEREEGSPGWRATLGAGLEWLARSRHVWDEMRERGELLPREAGILPRIDAETEELERELEAE